MEGPPRVVLSTFVVRLWRDGSSGQWRGHVVHLPSQAARHFNGWPQLLDFLNENVPGFEAPDEAPGPS